MNTNSGLESDGFGPFCYHFSSAQTATASHISNDFIGIINGITTNGTVKVMTSHICGIYDPLVANFPGVTSTNNYLLQFIWITSYNFIFNEITELNCDSKYLFSGIFSGPVIIQVRTDDSLKSINSFGPPVDTQQALDFVNAGIENGFRLTYTFTNNCPTTTVWVKRKKIILKFTLFL